MAKNVFSQGKLLQAAKQVFWEGVGSILIAVGVGVADKKLDSRRRQLNVHKRAGRNGDPRI